MARLFTKKVNTISVQENTKFRQLRALCRANDQLEIAVLIGSRATGKSHERSDWDIAIQWHRQNAAERAFGLTEQLRQQIAKLLQVDGALIDLIEIPGSRLAMRAVIAEEGIPLKTDTLAWHHFLTRTWAELEQLEWERQHEA